MFIKTYERFAAYYVNSIQVQMPFTCSYGTIAIAKKNLTLKQASKYSLLALRFPHKNNMVVLVSDLTSTYNYNLKEWELGTTAGWEEE